MNDQAPNADERTSDVTSPVAAARGKKGRAAGKASTELQVQAKVGSPDVVTADAGHNFKDVVRHDAGHKLGEEPTVKPYVLKPPVIATEVAVYIGIDAAAEDLAVCVLGPTLEVLRREKIPHTEDAVAAFLGRLPGCTVKAAYEAGPTGYRLVRWLRERGCTAFMVAPSRIPVASGERVKTDKRDALKLATLLATGQLDELQVNDLTDEQYADRQLVRSREQMVRKHTAICVQIRSLLLMHHIVLPDEFRKGWSKRMRAWLAELDTGHASLNLALREQLLWLEDAGKAVKRLDGHCRALAQKPCYRAEVDRLRSIPAFGLITAMVFLTELPDLVKRFESGEALARYLGLVPTEHSTGKTPGRKGHLTHDGNGRVRTFLVEASWRLIAKDPAARARYEAIKARTGGRKAIVAIARHLAVTIYAMVRDNKHYRRTGTEVSKAA